MHIYPVFLPLKGCPFRCIYCDQYLITGSDHFNLDEHLNDIAAFCKLHSSDEKEIAFFGGTFTALDLDWQGEQFAKLSPFLDDKTGIRYSTRPDCITEADLLLAKESGVRTIELGIQDFSDQVLSQSYRGYNQATAIKACKLIKDHNFRLGIQIMPGLPGFSPQSLAETTKLILDLKPDFVRIYPTLVLRATKLADLYQEGAYKPLELKEAISICVDLFQQFTASNIIVIKMGVQIDTLDSNAVVAGPYHKAFGELVKSHLLIHKLNKQIPQTASKLEIIASKQDISKLTGHANYGLNLLKQIHQNKIFKLTVDTTATKSIIRINSK